MLSDHGDYIGQGQQRFFYPGNGSVTISGNAGALTVNVSGGTAGDSYAMGFAAPPGQNLAPGFYTGAQRAAFREAGRPGIDISGDGRGCNTDSGTFEVRDIHTDANGAVDRLWIIYEQHCEGGVAATWGEIEVNEPVPDGPMPSPSVVRWPPIDAGRGAQTVPVTVVAGGPIAFTASSIGGPDPGDFSVREDDCSGHAVAAGATCQVWVRFVPTAAGNRDASLTLTDSGGNRYSVPLQGYAYGGTTRVNMLSDSGDYIGAGQNWSYTPSNAVITLTGTRSHVTFGVSGDNGDWWTADFAAPSGDILAPGSTFNATRYPFNNGGAGMDISGNGRGCNQLSGQFTVTAAAYAADGSVQYMGVDFVQHCENAGPALHGSFDFRVGFVPPDNPWLTAGSGGAQAQAAPGTASSPSSAAGPQARVVRAAFCPGRTFSPQNDVVGSRHRDKLSGSPAPDLILAGPGNDRVLARGGNDCVDGGSGNDHLSGGSGKDILLGGRGNDVLSGGSGRDVLDCGRGHHDVAYVTRGDRTRGCERVIHLRKHSKRR
ncbi:MAG: hypothetical protein ACJ77M_05495 [Thermoleophilaceae bacterium]